MREHSIEALFGTGMKPLTFYKLKEFGLGSISVNTPSLIAFLSKQPVLQYVHFDNVFLARSEYKWSDVAQAMPTSCSRIYINWCSHRASPRDAGSPVNSTNVVRLRPYQEPFPPSTGWQTNASFFEETMIDVFRWNKSNESTCGGQTKE
jgi:hypothetical protein